MRRSVCIPFVLLAGIPAVAVEPPGADGSEPARAAAGSVNAFAADLLKQVAASGGNQLFSPHSIAVALAMARTGAAGPTAAEIDAALHLPPDAAASFRELTGTLAEVPTDRGRKQDDEPSKVPCYSLSIANGLFTQRGWPFKTAFRSTLRTAYAADLEEVDFHRDPAGARKSINDWVADRTADRIQDIVPPDLPTPDTRMALANAIHFQAQWLDPFADGTTADAPFFVAAGNEVTTPRMRRTGDYEFGETPDATVLEIPYRGAATSMVVVLPKAKDGLDALVKSITPDSLAALTSGLARRRVALELPKFKFTSALNLVAALQSLGIHDAFSAERADFTGITDDKPLFVGAVLHKAFVAVDEKGTEAAAATIVMMRTGSARPTAEPTPFIVDHPFLFLIRHRATGVILFAGRVVDPTES